MENAGDWRSNKINLEFSKWFFRFPACTFIIFVNIVGKFRRKTLFLWYKGILSPLLCTAEILLVYLYLQLNHPIRTWDPVNPHFSLPTVFVNRNNNIKFNLKLYFKYFFYHFKLNAVSIWTRNEDDRGKMNLNITITMFRASEPTTLQSARYKDKQGGCIVRESFFSHSNWIKFRFFFLR